MNDQLLLENYILILKSTVEVYVHGTLESSNKKVTTLLQNCLNNTLNKQNTTYQEMIKRGLYTIENCKVKEIQKVLTKIQNEK